MSSLPPIRTLKDAEHALSCPLCGGGIKANRLEAAGIVYLICENSRCAQAEAIGSTLDEAVAIFQESVDAAHKEGVE